MGCGSGGNQNGDPLTGLATCDTKTVDVGGSSSDEVVFNLSNANCDDDTFSPTRDNFTDTSANGVTKTFTTFPKFTFQSCLDKNQHTSFGDNCTLAEGHAGGAVSYKIHIEKHDNGSPLGAAYSSSCIDNLPGSLGFNKTYGSNANIPLGSADFPFRTEVEVFLNSYDCGTTVIGDANPSPSDLYFFVHSKRIIYPIGLHQDRPRSKTILESSPGSTVCPVNHGLSDCTSPSQAYLCLGNNIDGLVTFDVADCTSETFTIGNLTTYTYEIVIQTPPALLCQGMLLNEPFAAGDGVNTPFMVCSADQFNNIGNANVFKPNNSASDTHSYNYFILKNIDMNLASETSLLPCVKPPFSNTNTIGMYCDGAPGAEIQRLGDPYSFGGTIHGLGHTISNIRSQTNRSKVGLINKLTTQSPATPSHPAVKDLNLFNIEVSADGDCGSDNVPFCNTDIGALVGHHAPSGTSGVSISNVTIEYLRLKSDVMHGNGSSNPSDISVGGLIGGSDGSASDIKEIKLLNSSLDIGGMRTLSGLEPAELVESLEVTTQAPTPYHWRKFILKEISM